MATSLQRQLAALAAPSSTLLVPERRISSILFPTKEAAGYSRDTFYAIGLEGLHELIGINPYLFEQYETSKLFNDLSVEFERAVEDRSTNEELDEEINNFLISISPYLMLKSSLKCLEWLVNRFHIQKFNISSILECVMPYYDTKSFSMIIQVLEIERFKNENKQWHWLISNVQTALPLSKTLLYSNSNPKFIIWLFTTFQKHINVHGSQPANLQSYISFLTSTVVGVLSSILNEIPKRHEKNQRSLYKSKGVIHCLWSQIESFLSQVVVESSPMSQNEEIHSMVYVIVSLLGLIANQKPVLNEGHESLIGKIMVYILKNHSRALTTQVYLLLNLLTPHAKKVFKLHESKLLPVLREITSIGQSWDLSNISSKILLDNVTSRKSGLTFSKIWNTVEDFELSPTQRSRLLKNIYERLRNSKCSIKKWSKGFLSKFERQYPIEFGLICQSDPQFASDLVHFKQGENLSLLAQHSDPIIRKSAVERLLNRFTKKVAKKSERERLRVTAKRKGKAIIPTLKGIQPDKNTTAQAILPRFLDDDLDIVTIVLRTKIDVLKILFTPSTLGDALIQVLAKRPTVKCTKLALKHLCVVARDSALYFKPLTSKILTTLIPFLFPTKEGVPMKLAITILKSKFANDHKFLKQYSSVERKGLTHLELCSFSYDALLKSSKLSLTEVEDNLLCKMLSLLTLTASSDAEKIIKVAESIDCIPTANYPVTSVNFPKCLQLARRKKILSLDFIFTTILKLNMQNKPSHLYKVFKFVWKISESIEKRNICVKFLSDFVKSSFSSPEAQINFWCTMIKTSSCKGSAPEDEFFMLRVLQFLASCIEQNPLSVKNYLMKTNISKNQIRTRSTATICSDDKTAEVEEHLLEILLSQAVYHDSHRIRSWALNCLSTLSENPAMDTTTAAFINTITAHRDAILADKQQTVVVISNILQTKQFSSIRDRFVNTIVDEATEQSIAVGLLKLCQLVSSQIFAKFLTTAKDLLAKRPESNILLAVLDCYDASVDSSLEIVQEALKHKAAYSKILSKLTREVVETFDMNWRKTIFGIIIETVLNCEIPEIKIGIQRCVRKWTLEASIISAELDKCIAMEKFEGTSVALSNTNLRKRKDGRALRGTNGNISKLVERSDWGTRTEVVLELIQSKKRLIQKTKLIRPLFKLLKICIALEEQSPVEYLKQLILTSLTLCCYDDFKSQESNDDWIDFNVDTVIDCLRCSRNPQTHHHALILLNYAAQLYPEQVLHGVMSLFTFMGNSILRQDDTYSTQLIQQTVTTIIPTFVNTSTIRKYSISRVSAGIYFAFASAVQDIPVHRRLPVFKSLVETLNPAESMWQLCVIIIDKALTRDKKRSHLTADMELALDIVGKFEPIVAISTMEKIYIYLSELPIYDRLNDEEFKIKRLSQSAASKSVVDLTRKETLRDVEILIYYTLELGMKICATFADFELEDKKLNYETLLEKCFLYSRLVSNIHENKIFRLITQRNLDIIERINAALDPNDLVRTVISILSREDLSVKKKMLDMLNHRIAHKLDWFGNSKILLELIDPLVEFSNCESESDDLITVIQTAFISLKLISRHLASTYPNRFVSVFELTCHHTTHSNRLLCASAFACLGELFCLKALILPNLSSVCASILKAFKASAKLNAQGMQLLGIQDGDETVEDGIQETKHEADMSISVANLLCISTLTCLTKLSDQLGTFLGSKFLQKALVAVFQVDGIFGIGEKAGNRKKTFDQRLKALLKSIGTKIPLRNSLLSIQKIFKKIISLNNFKHTNAIVLLVEMLKETLGNTPKTDFTNLFPAISEAFMVDFLSYRDLVSELHRNNVTSREVRLEELIQVEDAILDCLTTGIVLKVSEGVFRSFYHKIFDWAGENTERLITFYRFSGVAAEKLKSLFVTFAGYVISKGAETLNMDVRLTQAILKYFYHIFSNDREGFITIDRFNSLVKPLVDLIESNYTINGEISIKDINDTLVQLSVATNDLNRWQYLIELISLKAEHENKKVRLFVISTLGAAAAELGKDFLPLLPPAVPFLVELLNDDDEEVEIETKKMLITLEDMVGEQLQPYFAA